MCYKIKITNKLILHSGIREQHRAVISQTGPWIGQRRSRPGTHSARTQGPARARCVQWTAGGRQSREASGKVFSAGAVVVSLTLDKCQWLVQDRIQSDRVQSVLLRCLSRVSFLVLCFCGQHEGSLACVCDNTGHSTLIFCSLHEAFVSDWKESPVTKAVMKVLPPQHHGKS